MEELEAGSDKLSVEHPAGTLETVADGKISGWAWDSHHPDEAAEVNVWCDGDVVWSFRAGTYRADLEQAGLGNGRHGFSLAFPRDLTGRTVELRLGDGQMLAGSPVCLAVSVVRGSIDVVSGRSVLGWAANLASPNSPVTAEILVDGVPAGTVRADLYRSDLAQAGIGTGLHAFSFELPDHVVDGSPHTIALRVAGESDAFVERPASADELAGPGCTLPQRYEGNLDGFDGVTVTGWAWDRTHPNAHVRIAILRETGEAVAGTIASLYRSDLAGAGLGSGQHGFRLALPPEVLAVPEQTLTVAIADTDVRLGSITTPARPVQAETPLAATLARSARSDARYTGRLDEFDGIVFRGWAVDLLTTTEPVTVSVWHDDTLIGMVQADQFRSDLKAARVGNGFHAFEWPLPSALRDGVGRQLSFTAGGTHLLDNGTVTVQTSRSTSYSPQGYLPNSDRMRRLAGTPFEHKVYGLPGASAEALDRRFANRLSAEFLALAETPVEQDVANLVLLAVGAAPASVVETLESWDAQTHPQVRATVIVDGPAAVYAASQLVANAHLARITVIDRHDRDAWATALDGATYTVFARAGDVLHPSLARVLAGTPGNPDVLVWNLLVDPDQPADPYLLRRPRYSPHLVRHAPVLDTTFGVRSSLVRGCPHDVIEDALNGACHLLQIWLTTVSGVNWQTHAEALTVRRGDPVPSTAWRGMMESRHAQYHAALEPLSAVFTIEPAEGELPYRLVPRTRAARISVVVSFRNKAEMTVRLLRSIAAQRTTGTVEVVLIDNQSGADDAAQVRSAAESLFPHDSLRWIVDDRPFNHSRQTNAGCRAATGDVLVLCNNDVVLTDPDTLENLAAWALQPGVGTVGCRLVRPNGTLVTAGLKLKLYPSYINECIYAENRDPTYAGLIREAAGNTMALAAIAAPTYWAVGGLDDVRFGIGYNDVDFCARAERMGLTHLYLGHRTAIHEHGVSRQASDESLQKVWVRTWYADRLGEALFQTERQDVSRPSRQTIGSRAGDACFLDLATRNAVLETLTDNQKLIGELTAELASLRRQLSDQASAAAAEVCQVEELTLDLMFRLQRLKTLATGSEPA